MQCATVWELGAPVFSIGGTNPQPCKKGIQYVLIDQAVWFKTNHAVEALALHE